MFMQVVECQFSGNAKVYEYLVVNPSSDGEPTYVAPGMRAVVISKLKDDGTPSLSIVTIIKVKNLPVGEFNLMPVVDIIDPGNLANVTEIYRQAALKASP